MSMMQHNTTIGMIRKIGIRRHEDNRPCFIFRAQPTQHTLAQRWLERVNQSVKYEDLWTSKNRSGQKNLHDVSRRKRLAQHRNIGLNTACQTLDIFLKLREPESPIEIIIGDIGTPHDDIFFNGSLDQG